MFAKNRNHRKNNFWRNRRATAQKAHAHCIKIPNNKTGEHLYAANNRTRKPNPRAIRSQ